MYYLLSIVLFVTLCANMALAETTAYRLSDTVVHITAQGSLGANVYFVPHDNENTAVQASLHTVQRFGGVLVQLQHKGTRNINFSHNGRKFSFDPNRMFTATGIQSTLRAQGKGNYSKEAHALVQGLASSVLSTLRKYKGRGAIVAVHNKTNGRYSVLSYTQGQQYSGSAQAVHVNRTVDPDDFFYVNNDAVFSILKAANLNVVLQSSRASDDGSLSVRAAMDNIPYVNVEAQAGHAAVQAAMLAVLQ